MIRAADVSVRHLSGIELDGQQVDAAIPVHVDAVIPARCVESPLPAVVSVKSMQIQLRRSPNEAVV